MPSLDLIAARAITVGKRPLASGERFCRMDFGSQADADFMKATLRWSAFRFEQVGGEAMEPQPAAVDHIETTGEPPKVLATISVPPAEAPAPKAAKPPKAPKPGKA